MMTLQIKLWFTGATVTALMVWAWTIPLPV